MNIQIFGTKKCNDTKKAERFFKERGIKYQFIDMKEKGMSKGEFNSVAQANGGLENMVNWDGKDKDLLALIKYIADEDKLEKVLENPQAVYKWLSGKSLPSLENLLILSKLLNISIENILVVDEDINLLWRITMQGILNRINDVLVLQNGIRNYRIRCAFID